MHRFEEHTGEVRIRMEAHDLAGLFREAALALAEVMGAQGPSLGEGESVAIELEARDPEGLLVDWLNELIYRTDVSGKVFTDLRIESAEPRKLLASVRGARLASPKTAVKAATFHGLQVERTDAGYTASVILDV